MRSAITLTLLAGLLSAVCTVQAEVWVNEVAVDRSPQAVELWNTASTSADISGWFIDDSGGTTYYTIPPNSVLYGNSCAVFEADFNLNKSTPDMVRLFSSEAPPTDARAVLVDSYAYKSGPGTNNSYSRSPDAGMLWVTAPQTVGLSNTTGLSCAITPTTVPSPTQTPTPEPTIAQSPAPTETTAPTATPIPLYDHIYINEALPYPQSGEKEWVELYNGNNFEVVLTDWFIDDVENGGGTPRRFSSTLPSHGYAVVEFSSALLNNDADSVRLLNRDRVQIDGFEYAKPMPGQSYGRFPSGSETVCPMEPSQGKENTACIDPTPTQEPTTKPAGLINATVQPTQPPYTLIQTGSLTSYSPGYSQPTVLGTTTLRAGTGNNNVPDRTNPVPYLSFVSGSYSILTIVSLLIKIRNGLTA